MAFLFALAALPFHIAYGTATSAIVAVLIAFVVAVIVARLMRGFQLWEFGLVLAGVGVPLAYITGTPVVAVGLVAIVADAVKRRWRRA